VHWVIFGGFFPEEIAGRIIDSNPKLVVTAEEGRRAGRAVPLKKNVDDALKNPGVTCVTNVVVFECTGKLGYWKEGRDLWWHELTNGVSVDCLPEEMKTHYLLCIPQARPASQRGCCTLLAAIWSIPR